MQNQYSGQLASSHGGQQVTYVQQQPGQTMYAQPQGSYTQQTTYVQPQGSYSQQPAQTTHTQPVQTTYVPPVTNYQQPQTTTTSTTTTYQQAPQQTTTYAQTTYQQAPSAYQQAPSTYHHTASYQQAPSTYQQTPSASAYQVTVPAGYTVHQPTLKGSPIIQGNTLTTAGTTYVHPHDAADPEVAFKKHTNSVTHSVVNVPPESTVQSGTMGTLKPHQKPYAFTTVTYAKQPGGSSAALNESYAAKYAAAQRDGMLETAAVPRGRRTRFVRKQRGMCGGFNECLGAPYDTNGGRCGLFNIGCCDRGQRVPVDIEYSPETNF